MNNRGVAGFFLTLGIQVSGGLGDGSPTAGSRGTAPVEVGAKKPHRSKI